MAISKIVLNNTTQIDLTDTTAVASDVASGKYFYGVDGVKTVGTNTDADEIEDSNTALGNDGTASLSEAITALTTYANETTGASDTTLSDAVETLVDGYGQGGGISIDDYITGAEPSGAVVLADTTTTIKKNAFNGGSSITSIYGAGLTKINDSAFTSNTLLKSVYMGGQDATIGSYALRYCSNLEEILIPHSASSFGFGGYGLQGCTSLKVIDYGYASAAMFNSLDNCPLDTVILRKNGVSTLGANALDKSTAFKNGGTGGTVYVPSNQIENYKVASNWSTYYGYGTMTFVAIEGSQYEL